MNEIEELAKILADIDKILHERVRLAISTVLFHKGKVTFNTLKRLLKTSEGNLATHLRTLEQAGYVRVEKKFVGRKPQTAYELTDKGIKAYRNYLGKLARILQMEEQQNIQERKS